FWNTASSQTLNDEKQIHATVASKAIVVTEASIRCSFLFNDVDEGEGSRALTEPQPTPSPTHPSIGAQPLVTESSSSHDTTQDSRDSLDLDGTNRSEEDQVQSPHDSPLLRGHTSDRAEGALNLEELFSICTNLSNRVLALETVKDAQAAEIIALKARIKKLGKKCKPSISHHKAWLKSVHGLSMKKRFGKKDYVSKQGRKKDKKDKPEPTLDDSTFDADLDADHGMDYMDTEEPVNEGSLCEETKELVSIARLEDSTVRPYMKEEKAKEKGVPIKDIEDSSRLARSILTLKPLSTIDPKDKGKDELSELETEKEKRQREEEASKATIAKMYDEVQAGIKADELFAAKLQQEEREEYTIKERAKLLAETIVAQRKFRAAQRSAEIKSRPPTKSQLRNLMMTYLKNMGGYKHSQLKAKSFAEIQGVDLVLCGDLRTMFEETANDDLWKNQEEWILKSWNFYKNYRVQTLTLEDGTEIYMLAERSKELASLKQTAFGKDISNSLIVDSLLKTTWLSVHYVIAIKHWLFQCKQLLVKEKQEKDKIRSKPDKNEKLDEAGKSLK
nr:hypothetical protein [Tanacetum cinerariifolium]